MGLFGICSVSLLLDVPFLWTQIDNMRLCEMEFVRVSFSFESGNRTFLVFSVCEEDGNGGLMLRSFGKDD